MSQHDFREELAPRDVVARAIDYEMKKRGIKCVFLDISHKPKKFLMKHFPNIFIRCNELGIDIIDADDVGEITARVAMKTPANSSILGLSGEKLIDFHDVARQMSQVLGREITYHEQSHEDFHAHLSKVIPSPWHVDAVSRLFVEIADGALESLSTDARNILGRKPNDVAAFMEKNKFIFA